MPTQQSTSTAPCVCACGETFEQTDALLRHARTVHSFSPR